MDDFIKYYLGKRKVLSYSPSVEDIVGYKTFVENETDEENREYKRDPDVALPATNTENGEQQLDIGQVGFRSDIDGFNPDGDNQTYGLKYRTIPKEDYEIPYKLDYGYPTRRSLTSSILGIERQTPERWNSEVSSLDDDGYIDSPEGTINWVKNYPRYPRYDNDDNQTQANDLYLGEVHNSGPDARVISYNSEANNTNYNESRFAFLKKVSYGDYAPGLEISSIRSGLNKKIVNRSESSKYRIKKYTISKKGNYWRFNVGDYIVDLGVNYKSVPLEKMDEDSYSIKFTPDTKVVVRCSCNFWKWGGPDYWANKRDYLYEMSRSNNAPPNKRDPEKHNKICKHVNAVFTFLLGGGGKRIDRFIQSEVDKMKERIEERDKVKEKEWEKEVREIREKGEKPPRGLSWKPTPPPRNLRLASASGMVDLLVNEYLKHRVG